MTCCNPFFPAPQALKEELSQKTTLVAGLRGELRKYTDMVARLEHTVSDLRAQAGLPPPGARGRLRSQSETGAVGSGGPDGSSPQRRGSESLDSGMMSAHMGAASAAAAAAAPGSPSSPGESASGGGGGGSGGGSSSPGGAGSGSPFSPGPAQRYPGMPLPPTPPPAPRDPTVLAAGLEAPARLALYRDILSQAASHSHGRKGPPDLRDAQDLLAGKEKLDPGMEKVGLWYWCTGALSKMYRCTVGRMRCACAVETVSTGTGLWVWARTWRT